MEREDKCCSIISLYKKGYESKHFNIPLIWLKDCRETGRERADTGVWALFYHLVFTEGVEGLECACGAVIVAEGGRIGREVVVVKGVYRDAEISQVQCTTV